MNIFKRAENSFCNLGLKEKEVVDKDKRVEILALLNEDNTSLMERASKCLELLCSTVKTLSQATMMLLGI